MSDQATADRTFFDNLRDTEKRFASVPITAWQKTIRLAKLSGPEKIQLVDLQNEYPKNEDGSFANNGDSLRFAAELGARSIVDDAGERVFDDAEGRAFLLRQDLDTLNELLTAAMDLNGLGEVEAQLEAAGKK